MEKYPTDIKNKIGRYHEQLYADTFKNVDKMGKFIEK